MFEKLIELINKTHELQAEFYSTFNKIISRYPYIYTRQKGIRVPYTYRKYSTKYLNFNPNLSVFYVKFSDENIIKFSPYQYRKTWSFSKEDFE